MSNTRRQGESSGRPHGLAKRTRTRRPLALLALALASTAGAQQATLSVTPAGDLAAGTATSGALIITNTSTGGESIETVVIDLSTTLLPDLVFDPTGAAGDVNGKPLTPELGAAETGFLDPVDPVTDPYSQPRNGFDGTDGYDVITLAFTDFDPGESFAFSLDVDPTSIKDGSGISDARLVAGSELTGATVRVVFDDQSERSGEVFREAASDGGGLATLVDAAPAAPLLSVPGVTLAPTTLSADHTAAVIPAAATAQTIRVSGPTGAAVRLLQFEGALLTTLGNELEPFEANSAISVTEYDAVIGPGGSVDVAVTLIRDDPVAGGYNHFSAVIDAGGITGPNSNFVVLELDSGAPNAAPVVVDDGIVLGLGETVVINVLANDSDADGAIDVASLSLVDTPTAGVLSPGQLGSFSYTHDGVAAVTDQFTYTVRDNDGATSALATVAFIVRAVTDLPPDVDGDGTDNAADDDDDNDGLLDTEDPFAIDAANGLGGDLPLVLPLFSTDPGTGLFGTGFTGLMSNGVIGGVQGDDYQALYDIDRVLIDNTPDNGGVYTLLDSGPGDAFKENNSQSHAFQVGLNVDALSQPFVVHGRLLAPYFDGVTPVELFLSSGIYVGTGDQDNYLKMVLDGDAAAVEVLLEVDGDTPGGTNLGADLLASGSLDLFLLVDPAAGTAQPQLAVDGAPLEPLGNPIDLPPAWLDPNDGFGLAMGLIQTSSGPGPAFDANYDLLAAYFLATDDRFDGFEGGVRRALDVLANDHPDPALAIVAVGVPNRGGSAAINDGGTPLDPSDDWIDHTPRPGFSGIETFSYTVRDGSGLEATATVTVFLAPARLFRNGFEAGGK